MFKFYIQHKSAILNSPLLNESYPNDFQTLTPPLFKAFKVKSKQDQLAQVKVRLVSISFTQDFDLWGDFSSSDPLTLVLFLSTLDRFGNLDFYIGNSECKIAGLWILRLRGFESAGDRHSFGPIYRPDEAQPAHFAQGKRPNPPISFKVTSPNGHAISGLSVTFIFRLLFNYFFL